MNPQDRVRRDRVLLPGWWRFWDSGPQWSTTARQRIGRPAPETAAGRDWRLWEAELGQSTDTDAVDRKES